MLIFLMKIKSSNKKSNKTIAIILDAATRIFAQYGFDGARMDTIAQAAGINKATIYYHLGGKKALYTAVLHTVFSEHATLIAEQVSVCTSARERLRVIFGALHRLIYETPHINAIVMYEMASGGRNFPDIVAEDFTKIIGLTADALKEGHRKGELAAAHPMVIYLMAIAPMAYYEKIFSGLHKPLVSGSKNYNVPVISSEKFAKQLETFILKALNERDTP